MIVSTSSLDGGSDAAADDEIRACLDSEKPKSFFLYAGAGSGKTRSLVTALNHLRVASRRRLWLRGQRIGVITYTNAACDEIKSRLLFDPLVDVSTIHSFAWSLVGPYQWDIRAWLRQDLQRGIDELAAKQAKGRAGSKATHDRENAIKDKKERLQQIERARRFVYSPTGANSGYDALSHGEVISVTSDLLIGKETLQRVLVSRYPFMFIDESQDTNRLLMDAFLLLQRHYQNEFCLGLFGDTMQRIYSDGKSDLESSIPETWSRPVKLTNHRCSGRIIQLINRVRSQVDDNQQRGHADKPDGFARLFVLPSNEQDRPRAEEWVAARMCAITGDQCWEPDRKDYKALILEHHMAAKRMRFEGFFDPLYAVERVRTGLLNGTLPGARFFAGEVLPLVRVMRLGDDFGAAAIVRSMSPLLEKSALKQAKSEQAQRLKQAKGASDALMRLWDDNANPSFIDVLRCVSDSGLFTVPEALRPIAARKPSSSPADDFPSEGQDEDDELRAWDSVMATPFEQIDRYDAYVTGRAAFGTHHGVKGLEFPRVMVIIDDHEARGFGFSYEKLFSVGDGGESYVRRDEKSRETIVERTRRLFYVTCSRAESSLAIVAYSENPEAVTAKVLADGWFERDEVEMGAR